MRMIDIDALSDDCWWCGDAIIEAINNAPTVDLDPKWIPCSERLPKKENDSQRRGYYLTTNAYGTVGVTKYEFDGDFGFVGWGGNRPSDIRIIAWMPLPEPYGVEQE